MNNQRTEGGLRLSRRLIAGSALALVAALSAACGESTDPPIIGAIQGTVTVEGAGLDGATVSLGGGGSATTSGGGNYSFPNLEAGSYTVTLSGFPADVQFEQTSGSAVVATAGRAQVVDFPGTYIRTASITGTVMVNDEGVEGVSVSLSGTESKSGSTGADGSFSVSSLRMGSYTVTISGYDARRYVFDPASQAVSVALGESESVDFTGMIGEIDFTVRIENVSMMRDFSFSGALDTPVGYMEAGPIGPGMAYGFNFDATPGMSVSFAHGLMGSDGMFLAPDGMGIALWNDDGSQVTGDVTDQVMLWNADENVEAATGDDLPGVSDVVQVTLEAIGPASFHLEVANVSETMRTEDGGRHMMSVGPGVAVVHSAADPLFTAGMPDRGEGLQAVAATGMAGELAAAVGARTGLTGMLGGGVYASHTGSGLLFMPGMAASAGLEMFAEDGNPADLAGEVMGGEGVRAAGMFYMPMGGTEAGPLHPGMAYEFTVAGGPGDMLSFATGFVESNDLFYASGPDGISLFPDGMRPFSGDVTDMLMLWDAGTELNERPGSGLNQVMRQAGPNTGMAEMEMVNERLVCFVYPDITNAMDFIMVTITAN